MSFKVLAVYLGNRVFTFTIDASLSGLGTSLLQEGQPVAFASRALTPAASCYAQIKKELLSVAFACETFDMYLYGRDVVHVQTDHQPLEAIFKKDLGSAPQSPEDVAALTARLSLSFNSPVALIFTPVANLLLYG